MRKTPREWLHPHLRDLLVYMRLLREEGRDNRILRRLAQPQGVQDFVGFLAQATARKEVDTVVVSDLHLGSKHSLAGALRRALQQFEFKRLVLNGDIFDHLNLKKEELVDAQAALLNELQELSSVKEVVWIRGNHDTELHPSFEGTHLREEYRWEYEGKTYLAIHGDQFDQLARERPILYAIGAYFYIYVQRLGPWTRSFCAWLKRTVKLYSRALDLVAEGAVAYARTNNVDYVFCGHTHQARAESRGRIHYYNSGGWTESPAHLVTIGKDGVRVHAFNIKGEHLGTLSPLSA